MAQLLTADTSKGEKVVRRILLVNITTSHNPRHPFPELQEALVAEGFGHGEGEEAKPWTMLEVIHDLALSEDEAKRQKFCALVEKYDLTDDKGHIVPQSIIALAQGRAKVEIEPVVLRSFRAKLPGTETYVERYGIVAGERRVIAHAYNFAKHGLTPDIGATVHKLTVAEAFDMAVEENAKRRPPTDLEYGHIFRGYKEQINPGTNKHYTLTEIAEKLGFPYQFVRGREALTHLPLADQQRVEHGRLGVTVAIEKGLAVRQGKADANGHLPDKKETRQRALNLAQVQNLFDQSRNRAKTYLEALADVMQIDLDSAIAESDKRIEADKANEIAAAGKVEKKLAAGGR